jgi:hypothetical protein
VDLFLATAGVDLALEECEGFGVGAARQELQTGQEDLGDLGVVDRVQRLLAQKPDGLERDPLLGGPEPWRSGHA